MAFYALPLAMALLEASLSQLTGTEDGTADAVYVPPDTEMIYLAQESLLASQVSALRDANPEMVELFALLGAGHPYQTVFRREVEAVAGLLENAYGAQGRIIKLVNSAAAHTAYPLLNRTNLQAAVDALSQTMDEDDVLLLFLTSHGSPGRLNILFDGLIGRDLTPSDIDEALSTGGVKNVIIILSACYSGSFVDELARPERLVLTAARHDRTSFGCAHENEWTNWGRAFFAQALSDERDPRRAAEIAQEIVAKLEAKGGLTPSEPQISIGAAIGPALDALIQGSP